MRDAFECIDRLERERKLEKREYESLIRAFSPETAAYAAKKANAVRRRVFGDQIYIRGLIEISSICKNDCLYCGIRRSNPTCERYRLKEEEILACCREGRKLGFRTFVLQGGEDAFFTDDRLVPLIRQIKTENPDCAVTLSLGERSRESYVRLHEAGADRYLLRHETASAAHYAQLHPKGMSYEQRMQCLYALKEIGYQTGCGMMVGSPYQTEADLAEDLAFIESFRPQMCGVGPFIPHAATQFAKEKAGSVDMTCYLLSLIRLMHPAVLLPATTALGTLDHQGREKGILSGANVVMPNLSPSSVRRKYALYDNKLSDGAESAQCLDELKRRLKAIGCTAAVSRGDAPCI